MSRGGDASLDKDCRDCAYRAGRFHDWLHVHLDQSIARKGAYAFKHRKKPWDEIRDKINRKLNEGRKNYGPNDVTDASGFRIVTLFHDELVAVFNNFLDLVGDLQRSADSTGGGLHLEPIREVIFYRSTRLLDPSSIRTDIIAIANTHPTIKDTVENGKRSFGQIFKEEEESYSSIHVILDGFTGSGGNKIVASSEIQLRSVFEDAWGEISHKLDYAPAKKQRAESDDNSVDPSISAWRRHFDALKAFCDGCTQYASLIRRDEPKRGDNTGTRVPKPFEPTGTLPALFEGWSTAVQNAVKRAWEQRNRAERDRSTRAKDLFARAVTLFDEARELLNRETANTGARLDLEALDRELRAERGFCLRFTGNAEDFAQAERIYSELASEAPESPIPPFRLGQMKRDMGQYEEAVELLGKAYDALQARDDVLHPEVRYYIPRDLGYVHWRLSELAADRDDRAKHLRRSIGLTEEALTAAIDRKDNEDINVARNNLLYYFVDLLDLEQDSDKREALAGRIKDLLNLLKAEPGYERWREARLDTLMRAEHECGDPAEARRLAQILRDRLISKLKEPAGAPASAAALQRRVKNLSPDDQDMLAVAQHILTAGYPAE